MNHSTNLIHKPRVAIVGAGFGGMHTAAALKHAAVEITLIDTRNYFVFQPLLYQVASSALEPEEIAYSVRGWFQQQPNVTFKLARVMGVDWQTNALITATDERIGFDYVVFAAGATTNDFGVPGVRELAFPLKKLDDALALRIHIIKVFEEVDANPSLIEKGALNFVVVGGGPTGVEMAGALQELISMVLHKDYPKLDTARARVILIESGGEVLSVFDAGLRGYALGALQKLGVDVRFNEAVVKVTDSEVQFKSGNAIPTRTVVWGAGIKANPLAQTLGVPLGRGGRVVVNDDLSIPGHANAFVIGDMAAGKDTQGGIYPQLATSAIRSGKHVARQIERKVRGEATQPFAYADPGFMATIGRNAAVAQFPNGAKFRGRLAWFMWVGLHLLQLIGLRNRMQVFINWVWNYLWMGYSGRIYGIERSSRFGGGGGGADVAASNAMTEPQPK